MKKMMMIAAMMLMSIGAFAQSNVYIKPMVGGTLATLVGKDADDYSKMKLGLAVGGELGYNFAENMALTAGVLYSMQGSGLDDSDENLNMDYLNIPILFNYYVAPGLALKTGIQPGILLSHKTEVGDFSYTGTDGLNTVDIAVPFGVSYEVSDFVIDFRYNLGLLKIAKDDDKHSRYEDANKGKNSFFMLTLGYKINF